MSLQRGYRYTNYLQDLLMRLVSKSEYLIVPKGTKFTESDKLGLTLFFFQITKLKEHNFVSNDKF